MPHLIKFNVRLEISRKGRSREQVLLDLERLRSAQYVRKEIRKHIERSNLEIIVVVEGMCCLFLMILAFILVMLAIEPNSSCTFQARNSYAMENIVFDHWVTFFFHDFFELFL